MFCSGEGLKRITDFVFSSHFKFDRMDWEELEFNMKGFRNYCKRIINSLGNGWNRFVFIRK